MIGGRKRHAPTPNADMYSERLNSSLSVYNAELKPPATSYANVKSRLQTPTYKTPVTKPVTRAFFKDNHWRLNGIWNFWSWGSIDQGKATQSLPYGGGMDGTVRSTLFQRALVQLHDWSQNLSLYQAGIPMTGSGFQMGANPIRYQYPSFRVPQISTRTSGGPGPVGTRMQPTPRFTAVQRVPKYTAPIRYYNTSSRRTMGVRSPGGSSNVNTTPGTGR